MANNKVARLVWLSTFCRQRTSEPMETNPITQIDYPRGRPLFGRRLVVDISERPGKLVDEFTSCGRPHTVSGCSMEENKNKNESENRKSAERKGIGQLGGQLDGR